RSHLKPSRNGSLIHFQLSLWCSRHEASSFGWILDLTGLILLDFGHSLKACTLNDGSGVRIHWRQENASDIFSLFHGCQGLPVASIAIVMYPFVIESL